MSERCKQIVVDFRLELKAACDDGVEAVAGVHLGASSIHWQCRRGRSVSGSAVQLRAPCCPVGMRAYVDQPGFK